MIPQRARNDSIDATDKADPTQNAEPNDPIEPTEQAEPIEPIESTERFDPIESNDSSDHSDHFDVLVGLRSLMLRSYSHRVQSLGRSREAP